jgi:tetratricopeptide (TPR) repeat protein
MATSTIVGAVCTLALVTAIAFKNLRTRPWLAIGWLWFLGTLVPVIGLVQVGDQGWADRYTYLPLVGVFISLVWLACEFIKNRLVLQSTAVIVATGLLVATSNQLNYWRNTYTLFTHANQVTQNNSLAITILGSLLAKEGKLDQAMDNYRTALRYRPNFPEAHFFMGSALDQQGKPDEALAEYRKTLWFRPTEEQAHIFMGIILARQKKYDAAIQEYEVALKLNPDSAATENNLARVYHSLGQFDLAIQHYNAALALDPKLSLAHNNLGILLIQKGNLAEGTKHLREAVKLRPNNAESKYNLALALNHQGQWDEAAGLFAKVQGTYAANSKAHYEYGLALEHLKKTREALSQYAATLLIQPDFADALDRLAWILSTDNDAGVRNGTEAVKMAEQACAITTRQDPEKLKMLAAAYAETGRFDDAIKTLQTAQDLATKAKNAELINEYSLMLDHFQHGQSWRIPSHESPP